MPQRFYLAVLERGEHGAIGVWFPDFPGEAGGGRSQEEAMARAADVLEAAMQACAEREAPLPQPTKLQDIAFPEGAEIIGVVAVGATPPDPSERVNVYLPKSLIERVDRLAGELGMNRSSFFGMAASQMLRFHAAGYGTFPPFRK
ncbi:MAG TPA: type II toxin-antitoxin system HicB family antitoxin [Caulobacteraceae bacterium]|nr:type II toxin-antitoxin system HicB family antitoxin [Caulobacteraceae bacterium]